MESKDNGSLTIKSSIGPGQMFIRETNGSVRIEVFGVMFLEEKELSNLSHVIDFWKENGRLPHME